MSSPITKAICIRRTCTAIPLLGRLRGFLHAHLTWMIEHDYPNVAHYVPDLMAERTLVAVNRYYYAWVRWGCSFPR